ncbi:serine/arginine repetitive matrix protein 1-like [Cocos nucifera]|uniref:Serine/arginine repetitive matrix protein 1-like n=1 Tax=Cocos nucifera TaxID=13894 RepID=A0A8K0HT77_COCNU|nr:serine/arginine repetitive matrix protein 1-like [Cocos nucifera]
MAAELEDERTSTSDPDESDGEDSASLSLSLCDVALDGHDGSDGTISSDDGQLCPPPPTDTFEFFSGDLSTAEEMCSADDVFHQGQLLPYKPLPPQPSPAKTSDAPAPQIAPFDHRRSESLDRINRPRGGARLPGKYRRLRRVVSDSDPRTPLPPPTPRQRPKWYLVVFGPVRVPAAMEMKDIRNRQRRRRSPSLAEGGRLGYEGGSRPWKLLQSLSCKGTESAVVSPPPSFVSHVRG